MNRIEKIKQITLIALGFALATYLIMSATAMLRQQDTNTTQSQVK